MGSQGRILIVEDDEVARKNLSRLLNRDGHKTITASTGSEAINLVGRHSFDLVITDLVLEDLNGLEVLTEVKKRFKDIEVIVITGYGSITTAIEATKKRGLPLPPETLSFRRSAPSRGASPREKKPQG
jgi:Response regulator containing CheY-like receiver, AAA-type ATPase, and DNA-binding domains